jgi:hypothetical protein
MRGGAWRATWLVLVSCAVLAGGLVFSAGQALAAGASHDRQRVGDEYHRTRRDPGSIGVLTRRERDVLKLLSSRAYQTTL